MNCSRPCVCVCVCVCVVTNGKQVRLILLHADWRTTGHKYTRTTHSSSIAVVSLGMVYLWKVKCQRVCPCDIALICCENGL